MSALQARLPLVGSNWDFKQYGESGAWVSDAFPYLSTKVDDLCFLKSMMSDAVNHDPALTFMQTGAQLSGRPSMGSWLSYGLDSENKDLPAYIVMMCRVSTSASRQFEMAFRMQTAVPEATDISSEPDHVIDLYGPDARTPGTFAANCILARRMAERDVRFVQLFHPGWDHHGGLPKSYDGLAREIDQPCAALIQDLKNRDMLKDTLIIFGSEFGRTCYSQGSISKVTGSYGREHHRDCFTFWMAGGGVKPGISYGESDEFGFGVAENPVPVNDFHATVLHLLGINHERFTHRFQGRDFRLTDVAGNVIQDILA